MQLFYLHLVLISRLVYSQKTSNFDCRSNGCCDQHEFCSFWAGTNECQSNRVWMLPNCQISCNSCPAASERATASSCSNNHQNCDFWAGAGECQSNSRWMLPNCALACGQCSGQRPAPAPAPAPAQAQVAQPAPVASSDGPVCPREDVSFRRTLSATDLFNSANSQNCVPQMDPVNCNANACFNRKFRTMDGTCNNPGNSLFGAAATPFLRHRAPQFDDGFAAPPGSIRGGRPSARDASRFILASGQVFTDNRFSAMLMQFGQFLIHDISKNSMLPITKCSGCSAPNDICFSIPVDPGDPRFGCQSSTCCLSFTRSAPACGVQPRTNVNENTAFVDGSQVYGSSVNDADRLRDGSSGAMRSSFFNGQSFMPFNSQQCFGPGSCNADFDAGDTRVTLFIGLSSLHVIFLREHNRLAQRLRQVNPGWDGERIFQEARKIVGAELQAITFKEWLPKLLGANLPAYGGFNQGVNPSIAAEFSFGAMRIGHGMLQDALSRLTNDGRQFSAPFEDDILKPHKLLFEGGVDPLLKGLMSTPVKRPQHLAMSISERMFGSTDLGALNIQRSRDAGIASYNDMREFCGLGRARGFGDFAPQISDGSVRASMARLYSSPDNVDLYVGVLTEDPIGGLVGPTASCLITDQFKRLRDGDRFFFQNPGIFTPSQVAELEKVTFARIICDNADGIQSINSDVFIFNSGQTSCANLPSIDLNRWVG